MWTFFFFFHRGEISQLENETEKTPKTWFRGIVLPFFEIK
jgi:hypothetical protein